MLAVVVAAAGLTAAAGATWLGVVLVIYLVLVRPLRALAGLWGVA